jgi:hypothetical protein
VQSEHKPSRQADQVPVVRCTTASIMRSAEFRRGFDQVRAGGSPEFDWGRSHDMWHYERGRLFACVAPVSMPLRIDGKLNPRAVALFEAAWHKGLII